MSAIFPAIKFRQRTSQMYIASVPINLLERFSVDIWDPKNVIGRRGYQRKPDEQRVKKIAKYFEGKDAIMPVAGLVNIREKGKIKYENGKLIIPDGIDIWVVDMQHRLKGLVEAKDQKLLKGESFRFPIVITEGLIQAQEASQFYIINTKAKKMDVSLTRRLLIENDLVKDISDVKQWEIDAVTATIDLNNKIVDENVWYKVIRQPNEEKLERHIATEKSFVSSLRQIFIAGKIKNSHNLAKRLAKLWWAIRLNIPEAFHEPNKYLIQKTHGMYSINFFIAPIIMRKYKDAQFEKVFLPLQKLGAEFWRRSNKKGAHSFGTGMAGYSNLADYIKEFIK